MPNAIGTSSSGSNFLPIPMYSSTHAMMIMIRLRGSSTKDAKPELARMLPNAPKNENCIVRASRYIVQSAAPVCTEAPFCTQTVPTVPSCGAQISFSIFMASRMNSTSPPLTA